MWPKANFEQISKFHFLNFDKQIMWFHHVKVQAESFHLNFHIVGFHLQTQKLYSIKHFGSERVK